MRSDFKHKTLRIWLQEWGEWVKDPVKALSYPSGGGVYADKNLYEPQPEPSWRVPVRRDGESDASYNRRYEAHIKRLREFHHVSRKDTPPTKTSRTPHYSPHPRMSRVDKAVCALPKNLQEVVRLKYAGGLKNAEISEVICRTLRTVEHRTTEAYRELDKILKTTKMRIAS